MKNLITVIIPISLIAFFTLLFLHTSRISDSVYFGLIGLSIFTGFVIYFRKNISEIDLKNMKLIFQKTQKVKKEIDEVALYLAKIIANLSAYSSGSWLNRKRLNDQIDQLLTTLFVPSAEKKEILDLPRVVEKSMKNKEKLTPEEQQKLKDMFSLEETPIKK